jgi:Protein of unknown function (DUF3570)
MPPAWAQDGFIAKTETYTDSDNTTVVRPSVSVVKQLGWNVQAGGAYSVDIITTGSVDVVTQATQPEFQDRRQETEGNLTYVGASGLKLGGSFAYSTEADYKSKATSFTFARDFFERSTTISGRLGYVHDDVLHVTDPSFDQDLDGFGYTASVALALTRRLVWRAGYEGASFTGYMQSPYRTVRFGDISVSWDDGVPVIDGITATRFESHPDDRLRHSFFTGGAWHLGKSSSIHPQYTFYFDDWGVSSHELDLQYLVEPLDALIVRVRYRLYLQSEADFYNERYVDAPANYDYWSADKRLGPIVGHLGGLRVQYKLPGPRQGEGFNRVGLDAKVDLIRNEYLEYLFLEHRTSLVLQFGISTEY